MMKKIYFPVKEKLDLKIADEIEIYGKIFCGRDAVLPKISCLLKKNKLSEYGINLTGSAIFHTAVSPAGIGPTSSNKLDIETSIPILSQAGVSLHLGKGSLKKETVEALEKYKSYFAVTPPISALFASKIISQSLVAFPEEGMEAFYELEVNGLPAIIAIAKGKSIFDYQRIQAI